jgi:ATP-dependent RNA helicase DDX35
VHYLASPAANYVRAAVETVIDIHKEDLPGDVLVFLTGRSNINGRAAWLSVIRRLIRVQAVVVVQVLLLLLAHSSTVPNPLCNIVVTQLAVDLH